jgi:hypothetical protein
MSLKPFHHNSTFDLPKIKPLKTGELRAWERFVRKLRSAKVITAAQRDGILALLQMVGWRHKPQTAQSVLAAMADISVDTFKRGQDILVEAGMLRVHHIIQRGARGGGTVQGINCYELLPAPDPQAADESVLYRFKNNLLVKKALRTARRMTKALRCEAIDWSLEDERARISQQRQLAALKGG